MSGIKKEIEGEEKLLSPTESIFLSDKIRFQSERVATFRSLGIGRRKFNIAGRLGVNRTSILWQVFENEKNSICIVPLDCVTGIDLQIQGLSEGTTYLPLNAKLTLEFSSSIGITINGKTQSSMLLSGYFDLCCCAKLKSVASAIMRYKQFKIKRGLPSWGPWIPTYSPPKRKLIQTILLLWTIFSVLWALWQLYQHFKLFRQLILYSGELIYSGFSPLIDFCNIYIGGFVEEAREILQNYFSPLHILFVTISTPFVQAISLGYDALKVIYFMLKDPIEILLSWSWHPISITFKMIGAILHSSLKLVSTPVIVMFQHVIRPFHGLYCVLFGRFLALWNYVCRPVVHLLATLQPIYRYLFECIVGPGRLIWECIEFPVRLIFHILSTALSKLRYPLVTIWDMFLEVLARSSQFEFDANKERMAKMHRILHGSTKTFLHGVKNLFPSVLEIKKNIEDILLRKPPMEQTPVRSTLPPTPDVDIPKCDVKTIIKQKLQPVDLSMRYKDENHHHLRHRFVLSTVGA